MRCPFCSHAHTNVLETRETADETTRRRRECEKCERRFTTHERPETQSLRVIKKDGNRELFDRDKLLKGLVKACEKRPIKLEELEKVADDIERRLRSKGKSEVRTAAIGELVMSRLKKLDKVAYIRFASVYKDFKAIGDFKRALKDVS